MYRFTDVRIFGILINADWGDLNSKAIQKSKNILTNQKTNGMNHAIIKSKNLRITKSLNLKITKSLTPMNQAILKERTKQFALNIIRLVEALPNTIEVKQKQ